MSRTELNNRTEKCVGLLEDQEYSIALFSQSQDLIPPSLHTLCPPKGPVNRARQLRQKSFEHQVLLFFISSTRGTLTMKRSRTPNIVALQNED